MRMYVYTVTDGEQYRLSKNTLNFYVIRALLQIGFSRFRVWRYLFLRVTVQFTRSQDRLACRGWQTSYARTTLAVVSIAALELGFV